MKDQVTLIEASLRLNIKMARVMVEAMRFESSRQYLANAKRDIELIAKIKTEWNRNVTKTIITEV
jgi:hypothetical protein